MSEILEAIMVLCFGMSWPISIMKSYRSRTARGKSVLFIILILIGYVCGITSKIVGNKINYVLVFYIINLIAVSIDLILYIRNRRLDAITTQNPSGV
ncbi:MAG: hypothetical protein K0R46_618 [Herbinix sp.]|jgi:lipopolysaccharide export LptBFGC system permease protein LptF|nr:hypothetical protein [Herbinix sp.]